MSKLAIVIVVVTFLARMPTAFAATVLFCPLDSLDGWTIRCHGTAAAAVVPKSDSTRCVQASARQATVLLTRELPLDEVRGCRLEVGCLVRCEGLVPGVQWTSTAKIHLAVRTPEGIRQHSVRCTESDPWQFQGFTADVPESADRVVLNLGLEACSGMVQFDQLVVRTDRRVAVPLDLSSAANAGHEQLGLDVFPKGTLVWNEIPFQILDANANDGADCIRLKGVDHEDWPERLSPAIPLRRAASAIYILHATLTARDTAETPCAMWSAWFSGGHKSGLSLFEGRDIASVGAAEDLENWKIAWREKDENGSAVAFGVTKWEVYMSSPIVNLTVRSYRGASPVILAVTAVEEPPESKPGLDDFEGGGELEFSE